MQGNTVLTIRKSTLLPPCLFCFFVLFLTVHEHHEFVKLFRQGESSPAPAHSPAADNGSRGGGGGGVVCHTRARVHSGGGEEEALQLGGRHSAQVSQAAVHTHLQETTLWLAGVYSSRG